MATGTINHRVEGDKVLILERVFDAPRDLVFEMFSDCKHLKHWWGPRGWELPSTDSVVEFIERDGRTTVVSRSSYVSAEALKQVMDMGMLQGVTETWDRLEERLAAVK